MSEPIIEKLTVGQKEFDVKIVMLNQSDLHFYPENPRVYSVLNSNGAEPSQEEIEEHMCKAEHVKQLKISIESNGGLIDPLIVRDGDFTVLEGNSRLAAYRLLNAHDPVRWGKVKCKLLPANISDSTIFNLLGQYHIIGRKDWEPFEQANYLYRRKQQTNARVEDMATELGLPRQTAERMIKVIEFMVKHNDCNTKHWSYYEEYLKNAALKKYRETSETLDTAIAQSIKAGEIQEASDIRKLGQVAKVGDKQSKRLMKQVSEGNASIDEAFDSMSNAGKLDDVVKHLTNFRKMIADDTFEKQIFTTSEVKQRSKFEINKILKELNKIARKLQ